MESSFGVMEGAIRDNGLMGNNTGLGRIGVPLGYRGRVSGIKGKN